MAIEDGGDEGHEITLKRAKQRYLGRNNNKVSRFSNDFPEPSISSPIRSGALNIVGSTPRESQGDLDRMLYENVVLKNEVMASVGVYQERIDHIRKRQKLMFQIRRETFDLQQRRREYTKNKNELDKIKLSKANRNISY